MALTPDSAAPRAGADARADLLSASRSPLALDHRRLSGVDADAHPASVLILFGRLDDEDADSAATTVPADLDVLLQRRAATLSSHPGQVSFPGGRREPDDADAAATALREAQEETGLDPVGVEVLATLPALPLAVSNFLVTPVLGWWRHPSPVRVVDEAESADVFRAPVADLLDPAHRGSTVVRRDGREWRGPGFLVSVDGREHLVWGFTGMGLDALFDRLGWTEPWDRARELPLVLPSADTGR